MPLARRRFAVSTHLYHDYRLSREHLQEIGAHGFEAVELFATRTHFDYHNPSAVADLQGWLGASGLELHGIHAPISDRFSGGRPGPLMSLASADPARRAFAVSEAERALQVARRIPMKVLVAHLGVPAAPGSVSAENRRDAVRRSIDELHALAEPLGVVVAVELIPNELSRAGSLVHFVEDDVERPGVGICLDFGHAHMQGHLVDAIETVSEHLVTTHVHDNRGRADDHLVPFDGTIEWASALTALQKVGYEGTLVFEIARQGPTRATLAKARTARSRIERMLADG